MKKTYSNLAVDVIKKHIPFIDGFYCQLVSLFVIPAFSALIISLARDYLLIFLLLTLALLWITDVTLFILSLTKWWNIPLIIRNEGFLWKKRKSINWDDIETIEIEWRFPKTYFYGRLNIVLHDKTKIYIEPTITLIKDIRLICTNERVISLFNKAWDDYCAGPIW